MSSRDRRARPSESYVFLTASGVAVPAGGERPPDVVASMHLNNGGLVLVSWRNGQPDAHVRVSVSAARALAAELSIAFYGVDPSAISLAR